MNTQPTNPEEEPIDRSAQTPLPEPQPQGGDTLPGAPPATPAAATGLGPITPGAADGVAGPPPAAPEESPFKIGQRVWGPILRMTEDQAVISLSEHGLDEGVLDLINLRDEFGNLSVSEGDEVQAYIIKLRPSIKLAPTLYPPAAEVIRKLQEGLEKHETVRGRVTGVNRGGLEVDMEGRRAFCPYSQIEIGRCENAELYLNRILDFRVIELDPAKRRIVLSRRAVLETERQSKLGDLREHVKEGAEFEGVVTRLQPFGAFVDIGGLEGLVHISEISFDRLVHPQDVLRPGQKVRVKVLAIGQGKDGREQIRLSIKATLDDPWLKLGEHFHQGDIVTGTVVRVTEFGAFVKLYPGIEGLLHVSQYKPRAPQPTSPAPAAEGDAGLEVAEVAPQESDAGSGDAADKDRTPQVGQELTVRITRIEFPRRRISLALRDEMREGPHEAVHDAVVGEIVEGTVRAIKRFGVFVDLPSLGPWVSGLLPESETGLGRGVNLTRHFKPGEKARVEIIDVDDRGRIRLSQRTIKDREEKESQVAPEARGEAPPVTPPAALNALAQAFKRAQEKEKADGQS